MAGTVTIIAVMCNLLVAQPTLAPDRDCTAEEARVEEIVTTSERTEGLTSFQCQIGQPALADWKGKSQYSSPMWRIARIMCSDGNYELKGRA